MDENYILKGADPIVEVSQQSLGEELFYKLKEYQNLPFAIINAATQVTLSHKEIFEKSCTLATFLKNYGLNENHTVGIYSPNNLDYILPITACMYLGIPVTTFNSSYTAGEFVHVANITKPTVIFCNEANIAKILEVRKSVAFIKKIIIIDSKRKIKNYDTIKDLINDPRNKYNNFEPKKFDIKERTAFIKYSSGTTGLPKGVILTHYNYNTAIAFTQDSRFFEQFPPGEASALTFLPFYHGYGLLVLLYNLFIGRPIVMMTQFEPRLFFQSIQDHKVMNLLVVPPIANFIAKTILVDEYDLSSVKELTCGAAPLSKEVEEMIKKRLNLEIVRQGYGMTETSMVSTLLPLGVKKNGSVGIVLPYFLAKVIDPDTGKSLGPMEKGELCFKGHGIMKGYANNIEATNDAIDKDGWLRTGDIGYYDENKFIYVVDRLKELIKYNAFQVPPAEIESVLITHSKIQDAAVVGLPDKLHGELPLAFVVKMPNSNLTEEEVQKYVQEQLSSPKWLRGGVKFVKEIPKNPSGKILRRELRKLLSREKSKL